MQDKLNVELGAAFEAAAADRDKIEAFSSLAKRNPAAAADAITRLIPQFMERYRSLANESFGVDIARGGWKEKFKQKQQSSLTEAGLLLMAANYYLVYSWCQTKLDAYVADKSLSDEERARKVCEVGVEALRGGEAVLLHNLQELRGRTSGEAAKHVRDVLATRLASELATRTSVTINKRLAKALDEIRERNKPASRERFESLLKELYVHAPESWSEHHVTDWQLELTRAAAVKQIEAGDVPQTPQTQELELATFAERQALLKRGREVRLPPKEYELLKLLVKNPKLSSREAGQRLSISPGAARALKSRIKKTLGAA